MEKSYSKPSKKFGSDDYVEFQWHCPGVWIQVYRPTISLPGKRLPRWPYLYLGGVKGPSDRTIITAGKAISSTLIDLAEDSTKLKKCKNEWEERIKYEHEPPQLNPEWDPPIDLPWPEYVVTERGYDWYIPTLKNSKKHFEVKLSRIFSANFKRARVG